MLLLLLQLDSVAALLPHSSSFVHFFMMASVASNDDTLLIIGAMNLSTHELNTTSLYLTLDVLESEAMEIVYCLMVELVAIIVLSYYS